MGVGVIGLGFVAACAVTVTMNYMTIILFFVILFLHIKTNIMLICHLVWKILRTWVPIIYSRSGSASSRSYNMWFCLYNFPDICFTKTC